MLCSQKVPLTVTPYGRSAACYSQSIRDTNSFCILFAEHQSLSCRMFAGTPLEDYVPILDPNVVRSVSGAVFPSGYDCPAVYGSAKGKAVCETFVEQRTKVIDRNFHSYPTLLSCVLRGQCVEERQAATKPATATYSISAAAARSPMCSYRCAQKVS